MESKYLLLAAAVISLASASAASTSADITTDVTGLPSDWEGGTLDTTITIHWNQNAEGEYGGDIVYPQQDYKVVVRGTGTDSCSNPEYENAEIYSTGWITSGHSPDTTEVEVDGSGPDWADASALSVDVMVDNDVGGHSSGETVYIHENAGAAGQTSSTCTDSSDSGPTRGDETGGQEEQQTSSDGGTNSQETDTSNGGTDTTTSSQSSRSYHRGGIIGGFTRALGQFGARINPFDDGSTQGGSQEDGQGTDQDSRQEQTDAEQQEETDGQEEQQNRQDETGQDGQQSGQSGQESSGQQTSSGHETSGQETGSSTSNSSRGDWLTFRSPEPGDTFNYGESIPVEVRIKDEATQDFKYADVWMNTRLHSGVPHDFDIRFNKGYGRTASNTISRSRYSSDGFIRAAIYYRRNSDEPYRDPVKFQGPYLDARENGNVKVLEEKPSGCNEDYTEPFKRVEIPVEHDETGLQITKIRFQPLELDEYEANRNDTWMKVKVHNYGDETAFGGVGFSSYNDGASMRNIDPGATEWFTHYISPYGGGKDIKLKVRTRGQVGVPYIQDIPPEQYDKGDWISVGTIHYTDPALSIKPCEESDVQTVDGELGIVADAASQGSSSSSSSSDGSSSGEDSSSSGQETIPESEKTAWMTFCENQGYDLASASERRECVENELASTCIQNQERDNCREIVSTMCQDLLDTDVKRENGQLKCDRPSWVNQGE